MRTVSRNKQTIYFSNFSNKTMTYDDYGNATGQFETSYTTPKSLEINVSASRGSAELEQFGINASYTKTMVTDDLDCGITTDSILWIDCVPDEDGENGAVKHNYVVVSVAKSLNLVTFAIKEVSVG